jgi:hypothetical protein
LRGSISSPSPASDRFAIGPQLRNGIDQKVRALDVSELADVDDVGSVIGGHDRVELVCRHAIENAMDQPFSRRTNGALIGIASEGAFEQEKVGVVHQRTFDTAVDGALPRVQRIMKGAAMRGIDADGPL